MKRSLKEELSYAFEAPKPLRKKEFLNELPKPGISMYEFIISQVGYIRSWIWYVSVLVFGLSLAGAVLLPANILWPISAFTPLLALTIVTECGRSESYEMAELEIATRFSLKSVMIARLGILGVENLVFLFLMIPVEIWKHEFSPIRMGLYILTPYLLTTFIGLYIVRKFRGLEATWICAGTAGIVSFFLFFFQHSYPQIYQNEKITWWVVAVLLLCVGTAKQTRQIINRTEELT